MAQASADGKFDYDLLIIGCGVGGHGAALHAVDCVSAQRQHRNLQRHQQQHSGGAGARCTTSHWPSTHPPMLPWDACV